MITEAEGGGGGVVDEATVNGDPTDDPSAAVNAPFTPDTLSRETTADARDPADETPPRLSKVARGEPDGDAPNEILVTRFPAASNTLMASPLVDRPTPDPP